MSRQKRDAYPLAPAFADWALRLVWLGRGPLLELDGRLALDLHSRAAPSAADSTEPPSELQ